MSESVFLGLVEVLGKYGWTGILALVGLMWVFFGRKTNRMQSNNDKRFSEIIESQQELTSQIAENNAKQQERFNDFSHDIILQQNKQFTEFTSHTVELLKTAMTESHRENEHIHNELLKQRMDVSPKINEILRDLTHLYNADTTIIFEFHNGSSNINGDPFAKFDLNYQYCMKGKNLCSARDYNNLAYSNISGIVNLIPEGEVLLCENINDNIFSEAPALMSMFMDAGVKSFIAARIYDSSDILIGVLCLLYTNSIPAHANCDVGQNDIIHKTQQIEGLLSIKI